MMKKGSRINQGHAEKEAFSETAIVKACWSLATNVGKQSWVGRDPEYPGHDPDTPASTEFAVMRLNQQLVILAREEVTKEQDGVEFDRVSIRLCATIRNELDDLSAVLEKERYEGWKLLINKAVPPLDDKSVSFAKLLAESYTPIPKSDLTAKTLTALIGNGDGRIEYQYVLSEHGKVTMFALAGYRTGVTTSALIYDEQVERILSAFKIRCVRNPLISKNTLEKGTIESLISEGRKQRKLSQCQELEKKIAEAEENLRNLRAQLNGLQSSN